MYIESETITLRPYHFANSRSGSTLKLVSTLVENEMTRQRTWIGDLAIGTARPGVRVRCVRDIEHNQQFREFWGKIMKGQSFLFLPKHMEWYRVRSLVTGLTNVHQWFHMGIVLERANDRFPLMNPIIKLNGGIDVEPYFPLDCFVVSQGHP